jgi:hypothetical protein
MLEGVAGTTQAAHQRVYFLLTGNGDGAGFIPDFFIAAGTYCIEMP